MTRNKTTEVPAPTRSVEVQGVTINVPVGSMDEPTEHVKRIVTAMQDERNWKLQTKPFITRSQSAAEDVAYGLDWFMGGHETMTTQDGEIIVTSKGYYHYIGA